MGVPVEVDSDDLEALLFATGVIEKIELALQADRQDPQAVQGRRYAEARRRMNSAKLNATRVESGMFKPLDQVVLSEKIIAVLEHISDRMVMYLSTSSDIGALNELRREHLVEIANVKMAVFWGADQPAYNTAAPDGSVYMAVRATERGHMWLRSHPDRRKHSISSGTIYVSGVASLDADGNALRKVGDCDTNALEPQP